MALDPEALARAARAPVEMKKDIQKEMSMEMSIGTPGSSASRRCHICGGWFSTTPIVDGVEAFGAACDRCAPIEERERWALGGAEDDPRVPERRHAPMFARAFRTREVAEALRARPDLLPAPSVPPPPRSADARRGWIRLFPQTT